MIDIRVELSGEVDTYYSITTRTTGCWILSRRGETHSRVNKCVAAVTGEREIYDAGVNLGGEKF